MQICEYSEAGDKVITTANSNELKKMGWPARSNTPTAYLTGVLLAHKSANAKGKEMVLDIGLNKPTKASTLFAAAKGAIDAGLKIRANIQFDEKRINGEHISENANKLTKGNEQQFASYKKNNVDLTKINELFNKVKGSIKVTSDFLPWKKKISR